MNFAVYGMNGIYYGFIQQYVSAYQTPVAAGYLLAVGPAVTVIAPFFWGWAADRARFKNTVLALAVAGGALTFCLLGVDHSFIYMFALLVAVMFFISPFGSLIDTVSLEYSNEHDMSFGFMRVTGTVAFGVMTLIISLFYAQSESSMFIGYVLLAAVGVCVTLFAPRVQGHAQNREKYSLRPIFADKKLMGYFFVIGISQFAWMCYLNNEPAYITDTLGLPQWVWGLNVAVTVLGEVPFFFLFKRIFTRFGSKNICGSRCAYGGKVRRACCGFFYPGDTRHRAFNGIFAYRSDVCCSIAHKRKPACGTSRVRAERDVRADVRDTEDNRRHIRRLCI